ncbi:MAG TPA: hypothetical protein VE715_15030 [Blastocatellia bacterium]|nr:hypothetical protein [Blastocatellia bacterium]
MNTLTLELPKALDELPTSVAEGRRTSKVEIALQALQEYLGRQDEITKEYLESYLDRHAAAALSHLRAGFDGSVFFNATIG